ncbi:MAG: HAD-IA family hydrolase, partial [Nanoarchaeota archaeon]|nr:HAD-IA family hydrolase [Nanoarchaeota archaeon]
YKAVIFDLDGTLVYTAPEYRYEIVGKALKELGTTASNHHIDRFWFEAERNTIIKKHFRLKPELFWSTYNKYDSMDLRKQLTKLYDDVGFIQELKEKGYKIGIVTGATHPIAELEVSMIGKDIFDAVVIVNSLNGKNPKPHPQGIKECLDILGVKNNEAIYVGNADEDVISAKNAQVFDVLLLRGEHVFQNTNPTLTINSLYELRNLLKL